MSKRNQISMTDEEVASFLGDSGVFICASNGADGYPHLMPLWYVVHRGDLWAWTYGKSQKVLNMERDPRVTIQVEDGKAYEELRGVMVKAEVEVIRDPIQVAEVGMVIFAAHAAPGTQPADAAARERVNKQAEKRVALRFRERSRASWDHSKLVSRS